MTSNAAFIVTVDALPVPGRGLPGTEGVVCVAPVVPVVEELHAELFTLFESSVTAPLRANRCPEIEAPVVAVMDASARTVPTNVEFVPNVAELVTSQNTLQLLAPLISETLLELAVVRLLAAWKTKTEFGSPLPSRMSVPVMAREPPVYTPATKVWPPRSAVTVADVVRPAASLYAVVTAACAWAAAESAL